MGLKDKLQQGGNTKLTRYHGATPPTNQGATKGSKLHANGDQPSYSLDGSNFSTANNAYQAYDDGVRNALPRPSALDLDGKSPSKYTDNLPG